MKKIWIAILLSVAVLVMVAAGCQVTRAAYESADYRVVRADGKCQVRDYPSMALVETSMAGGDNGGFMRLFRFISGGNEPQQKISMTTPVFMSGSGTNATMAFVMPAKLTTTTVPPPKDRQLSVREFAAGRFAVLRFRGSRTQANEARALAELRDWIKTQGLPEMSPPIYGYFDPPWTLSFLRRNEVMIRTAGVGPN